jgi:hypothetical protein
MAGRSERSRQRQHFRASHVAIVGIQMHDSEAKADELPASVSGPGCALRTASRASCQLGARRPRGFRNVSARPGTVPQSEDWHRTGRISCFERRLCRNPSDIFTWGLGRTIQPQPE